MIEKKLALTMLFDFYENLLTQKHKEVMSLYLIEDYGLVEIGEELGISRQAVYDKIKTSSKQLEDFEEKLGLVTRYRERQSRLVSVVSELERLGVEHRVTELEAIVEEIQAILSL
jgi:predicted DNA-binding protein YlxM (UPF0122 family)